MSYKNYCSKLVEYLGGATNISSVTHCATRLRFILNDGNKVERDLIEELSYTMGVVEAQGTFQVVIGPNVGDVYDDLLKIKGIKYENVIEKNEENEKNKFDNILAIISAIFTPYIPVLAASGIIQGLLALFTNCGVLSTKSSTYAVFAATGNALFYFFPIALAYTAAKRFNANPYVGLVIGAALMEPNLTSVCVTGKTFKLFGLSIMGQTFSSTVIPIIIAMWAYALLEKVLKKYLPKSAQFIFVPTLSLIIMVPATLLIFGPIGSFIANGIAAGYKWLLTFGPLPISIISGGFFIYIILFGVHWAVFPIIISMLTSQGYEYALCASSFGNYAVLGVCLAVLLTSKNRETKSIAASAAFVNFLSGVTEPGLYGIIIKNKKYFIALTLGGLAGGLVSGLGNCYLTVFAFTGLFGLPAFAASPTAPMYFVALAVSIIVSFTVTVMLDKGLKRKK